MPRLKKPSVAMLLKRDEKKRQKPTKASKYQSKLRNFTRKVNTKFRPTVEGSDNFGVIEKIKSAKEQSRDNQRNFNKIRKAATRRIAREGTENLGAVKNLFGEKSKRPRKPGMYTGIKKMFGEKREAAIRKGKWPPNSVHNIHFKTTDHEIHSDNHGRAKHVLIHHKD